MRQIARQDVFRIATEEVFRKGYVEHGENQALVRLTRFLRLDANVAKDIARTSRRRMAARRHDSSTGPAPVRLYWRVLEGLHDEAGQDATAGQILHALRVLFRIPDDVHHNLKRRLAPNATVAEGPVPTAAVQAADRWLFRLVQAAALTPPVQQRTPRPADALAEQRAAVGTTNTRLIRPLPATNAPEAAAAATSAAVIAGSGVSPETAPASPAAELMEHALDQAARRARECDAEGAMRAMEPALSMRPGPEGFEVAFQSLMLMLLEDATRTQSVDALLAVVQLAARVAAGTSGGAYRWAILVDVMSRAGTVLADWSRWPEHAKLLPELDRMSDAHAAATPAFRARALTAAVRRCIVAARYEHAVEFYRGFSKVLVWMEQDEVRAEYAAAQALLVEHIVGHHDRERDTFLQLLTAMQGLVKNNGLDRCVARAFTSVAVSVGVMLLKIGNPVTMKSFLATVAETVRSFPGDKEMALLFARALLNTAMVATDLKRQSDADMGFIARLCAKLFPKPSPMIAELVMAMTAVVASLPHCDAMSDIRKRFEGLTGARLIATRTPTRPARGIARMAVKPLR